MLQIKTFPFNPFQVNTYVLYDETGECAIVDAATYEEHEQRQLQAFMDEKQLKPVCLLTTHAHIDHILGNNFINETYALKPLMHKAGIDFLHHAVEYGQAFGFNVEQPVMPEKHLEEGDIVSFGHQKMKVLETPGHADGSLCFYHEKEGFVIAGDVLFQGGIGRTDLPTGNYETLIASIRNKLLSLPPDTKVYCGHGPATEIGFEKEQNPYINGSF